MEQLSIFDFLKIDEMYDGYVVRSTKSIEIPCGCRIKIKSGSVCYLVTRHKKLHQVSIAFPNNYGGSFGFCITEDQFQNHFKSLGEKIYPTSNEIWNGSAWIKNPVLN